MLPRLQKLTLFCAVIFSVCAPAQLGQGGDVVSCRRSTENNFEGYYSLDYLLTHRGESQDIVLVRSLEESLTRIAKGLGRKAPGLLPSFLSFRKHIFNTTDITKPHYWEEAPFGLFDIKDEKMVILTPSNCRNEDSISIVQAVVRQPPAATGTSGAMIYRFVPSVVNDLKENSPLQLSFLLVHEWLWEFSDSVDRNRRLNHFLHSRRLDVLDRAQVLGQLKGMGLKVPEVKEPVVEAPEPKGRVGLNPSTEHPYQIFSVPTGMLPGRGLIAGSGRKYTLRQDVYMDGYLRGVRAKVVHQDTMENIGFNVKTPNGGGGGIWTDVTDRTQDGCGRKIGGMRVCDIILQPAHGQSLVKGTWTFELSFDAKKGQKARVYSFEIYLEAGPKK